MVAAMTLTGRDDDNPPDAEWQRRRHDEYDNRSERTWPSG